MLHVVFPNVVSKDIIRDLVVCEERLQRSGRVVIVVIGSLINRSRYCCRRYLEAQKKFVRAVR